MANIPIPENDDSLELNVRYQPDMVLEGMLDATVPEMKYLRLSQGNETYDLLGAQTGDQILELLSEDLTAADEGKFLSVDQGEAVWGDAPSGLPEITNADEGKVLTVVDNSGTLEAEWAEPGGGDIPTATEENLGMGLIVGRKMIEFVPDQTLTFEGTGTIYSAQITGATRTPDDLTEGQAANATITIMGQSSSMPISYTGNISALSLPGFAVSTMGANLYLYYDTDSWYFGTDDSSVEGMSLNLAVDLAEGFAPTWGCPKILVGESIEVYYDGTSHETMIVISDSDYNELKEGDLVFAPFFSGSPVVQEYIANTYQVATSGMNAYRVKTEFTLDPVYQVVGTSHATIISASIKANNLQYVMG